MFAAQLWSGLLIGNQVSCAAEMGLLREGLLTSLQATYFYTVAGMGSDKAFALGLGTAAIQWVAVVCAFWAVTQQGRRTLYLYGVGFQTVMLLLIGVVAAASKSSASFWVQATFLMLIFASYGLTVGPITFTIVAEVSSVKLRAQTCAIARASYYAMAVPMGYITSYSLNPTAWNLQGKSAFIWFATATGVFIFTYFMVPETKDRSFRELDVLYHRGVPARKFKSTVVDKDEDE
jgi:SP family general alpha glucoside:H+ symporter-like MFS transporter